MKLNWLKDIEVEEISYVDRPAIDKRFIAIKRLDEETKSVLPFHANSPLPEDEPWDAGAEVKKAEINDLKMMCAWFDSTNPDVKSSYKLPHHKCNSSYNVVWNGVKAAMGALLGARGGVDIPTNDRKAVYNHLAKHYAQFDKEPPDFKEFDEDSEKSFVNKVKDIFLRGQKVGRVLSKANEDKLMQVANELKNASDIIKAVLSTIENKKEDSDMNDDEIRALIDEKFTEFSKQLEDKFVTKTVDEEKQKEDEKIEEEKNETKNEIISKLEDINKKFENIDEQIKSLNDEIHKKPESDKQNVNDGIKKEEDSDDFAGIFGFKF